MDALSTGGIEGFRDEFNALGEEMQQAILEESPALKKFFRNLEDGAADSEQAIDDLDKEIKGLNLKKLQRDGKVWDDVVDAMEDAGKGGKDFTKSYGAVIEQVEGLNEAMGALTAIQNGSLTSAEDLTDAYDVLASYTGVSADALRNNLDPAIWAISSDMDMASMSASYLCNWLWSTAGVTFSAGNWQAQLAALAGSADATTANVARLVQTMLQCAGASLSLDGDTIKVNWGSGSYTPPSARSSGSRSSGGGGSSKSQNSSVSVSSDIEKMLDKMDGVMDIEDHRRQMAQLAQDYHDARGEIQGVLLYLEKERAIVLENSGMLETYIATLETQIEAKKKILAQNAEGSTQYQQAMADLAALQEQHQEYSEQLLQNKIDLEELEQAMEDQRDAIRDMEIDLRELIHEAIMDREELERSMLEGRIEFEEEILDVLTRRYEEERDQLLELAEVKREALNNELTLLDEQLEARKRLNEEEDRAALLAEKEAQLARIAADPTRKKEELALREEIAELREEIAWDLAEKEVDAQKEAIEAQITSIDDYIEYVEGYYEELLANPRKLMEEMQNLLTSTDADILAWLEKNHQDYQTATDATRQEMSQGWQDMLDQMRGHTQTYWDEVESIIAQGDDAIIQFLMDNSADYKEAGHLQAAAYVDEWKQLLEDLRNAYKQVAGDITTYDYTPTTSTTTSDSSSSSSSSSSSTKKTKRFVASGTGYAEAAKSTATSITYSGAAYIKDPKSDYWYKKSDARLIDAGRTYYWKTGTTRYVKKYLEGGLATGTGLAWVDGSTSRPERILSPYQTELFEDLLKTLHSIRTIQTPAAVVRPHLPDQQQPSYHIDSITVQVQKLESEQDYEEMAERVGEHIMNKVSRGMTVGGIRLG